MGDSIAALKARLAEAGNLRRAAAVLEWDLQTYMPPGGAKARSEQIGYLARLAHEKATSDETGALLAAAEQQAAGADPDSDDARLVKVARRDYDQQAKIPTDLASALSEHAAFSQEIWARAREANDYAAFRPLLDKTLDLCRQVAEHLGYEREPYDALLDLYEPGAKTAELEAMFGALKPELIELTQAIVQSPRYADTPTLPGEYPVPAQSDMTHRLTAAVGYDFQRGRQDQAPHPFCTNFDRDDVRITTRFDPKYLPMALYASLHEAGHALYEQGSPEEYDNTPLGGGASMGIHESQSRMWENLVGRGRPFIRYAMPQLQAAFPALAGVDVETFYRAVNRVTPSLIRVEADEVTYNLHVLLRFELERALLAEKVSTGELPDAWNAKMQEYLGVTPPDDKNGVLQDVHWSGAMIGYFPTYTLGNLVSGQLWHAIGRALPDLPEQLGRGEFAPLLGWLREHVHRYGRKYLPNELIQKATGEPLSARYYLEYLKGKYGELYALAK